tara:strand:+ start:1966 stop:3588 length:1623 start_codon:yes stop_codon:yes gene_type:complete
MVFTGEAKSDFLKDVIIPISKRNSVIDYAATDFLSIRDSIIEYIQAVYPLEYENFSESDLGIMLIEIVAYMGSVFSLKADMLANENYLQTAKLRKNVKKLLGLIGVRMKGPISAAANARITWPWISSPWVTGDGEAQATHTIILTPDARVFSITSPEDGAQVSYTLYKVLSNGQVDLSNQTGNISLEGSESEGGPLSGVHENLVLLEGSLVSQTGGFTSTESSKIISLTNSPVVEGSINVFIEGDADTSGTYRQVEHLYAASGEGDKIFQVSTDDDFTANVVFGDNVMGQSPNVGDSYFCTYRVGGGSRGNIRNGIINLTTAGTLNSLTYNGDLTNISVGTGGADAETTEHAKRYAPLTFRRQDRLVTLPDYESFANTYISPYGSVGKASVVTRSAFCSANILDVYILEKASDLQLRRATPQFKKAILESMNLKKMLTDELVIVDGLIRTLDLVLTIRIDKELKRQEPEIISLVRNTALNYFYVDNREFGQEFILQDLIRSIHDIDKVRFATIDNLDDDIKIEHNEIIQLNNLTVNIVTI